MVKGKVYLFKHHVYKVSNKITALTLEIPFWEGLSLHPGWV